MENPLKNINFRNFVIKLALVIGIGLGVATFISIFFSKTPFFLQYLSIPSEFYVGIKNRGILINAFLFGIIASGIFGYRRLIDIRESKFKASQLWFAVFAIMALLGTYLLKYLIHTNPSYFLLHPIFWGYIKLALIPVFIIFLLLTAFGWPFAKYFVKNYRKEILFFAAASIGFFFLMLLVQNLWTYFSGLITSLLYHIFSLFFNDVTYRPYVTSFTMAEGGGPLLGINGFRAIVGKPCSGIDSFLLFTSLYAMIFILDYRRLNRLKASIAYMIGIIGMFLTNLLRILLLFIVGAYWSPKFAIGMFHSNVGWILFIAYFFVFWYFASRAIYKKEMSKEEDQKRGS